MVRVLCNHNAIVDYTTYSADICSSSPLCKAHILGRLWLPQLHRVICRCHFALCAHVLHLQDTGARLAHAAPDSGACTRLAGRTPISANEVQRLIFTFAFLMSLGRQDCLRACRPPHHGTRQVAADPRCNCCHQRPHRLNNGRQVTRQDGMIARINLVEVHSTAPFGESARLSLLDQYL